MLLNCINAIAGEVVNKRLVHLSLDFKTPNMVNKLTA